jgi:tetratricopeptide (TPR) repeat protein
MRRLPQLAVIFSALLAAQAQEPSPSMLSDSLERARLLIEKGNLDEARTRTRSLLESSLAQLGACYLQLTDYPTATQAFEEGLAVAPASLPLLRGQAIVCLRTGRYEEGIRAASNLRSVDPSNPEAPQLLGKLHYLAENYQEASSHLEAALALEPTNLAVAYTLGLAYLNEGKSVRAEQLFHSLIERLGDSGELRILIGRAFRETADAEDPSYAAYLEKAIAHFKKAIELNPQLPRAHYYLALTYLKLEGIVWARDAISELKAELAVNPTHLFANYYMGLLLCQNRQYEEALDYLWAAKRIEPNYFDADLLIGRSLFWLGRYQDAIEVLERLARSFTGDPGSLYPESNVHYLLGRALLRVGRREEAEEHLSRSKELKQKYVRMERADLRVPGAEAASAEFGPTPPEESVSRIVLAEEPPTEETKQRLEKAAHLYRQTASLAYQLLGRAAAAEGDFSQTAHFLELAAGWDDSIPDIYFNLGVAHYKAGRLEDSSNALRRALERNPENPQINQLLVTLVLSLMENGRSEVALKAADTLLAHHPEVADLYFLRARVHYARKAWESVIADLEKAAAIRPDFAEAFYRLSDVYTKAGKPTEAARAMKRYHELK